MADDAADESTPREGDEAAAAAPKRVFGLVRDETGEPVGKTIVRAYDRDLRSEHLLGEGRTRKGRYEISYDDSALRRAEKTAADLVVAVLDEEGGERQRTPIHFNAPDQLELDVNLGGDAHSEPSRWQRLNDELLPLLEGLDPRQLREDEQYRDISFLAGESEREPGEIVAWAVCFILVERCEREEQPLPPEVLFAFLVQGQPSISLDSFAQDMQQPERQTLREDKLLRTLAEMAPALRRSLLEKAIEANLVPPTVTAQIEPSLEALAAIKRRYTGQTVFGGGKGTIDELLEIAPLASEERAAFMTALTEQKGSLEDFWQELETEKAIDSKALPEVQRTFELGALTRNHIPLVRELSERFSRGDLSRKGQLAELSREDWQAIFAAKGRDGETIGVPAGIDGKSEEEQRETFAEILDSHLERTYPTASFAAKLGRGASPRREARGSWREVGQFLRDNPDFHLDSFRVEHYAEERRQALDGVADPTALVEDLKSAQRVFKLSPTHRAVDALLSRDIDSAQRIYFMGETRFMRTVTAGGDAGADDPPSLNRIEARQIYRRAEGAYATALATFGDYNLGLNGVLPSAVPGLAVSDEAQAKIAAMPTLRALFGSLDYCECTECRSVYSPAAYLVDLMRFLSQRASTTVGWSVRDVLLDRRQDLGRIELSCENTNTPLPYVDLVNEVLEEAVAGEEVELDASLMPLVTGGTIAAALREGMIAADLPVAADAIVSGPDIREEWAIRDDEHAYTVSVEEEGPLVRRTRQTFFSAAEVRANPEYVNENAYATLRKQVFPLSLPFDLWQLESRAYLEHLGLPQPRLLELFQRAPVGGGAKTPSDLQIECARLGIGEMERQVLTATLPGRGPWDFWGLKETANAIPNPGAPTDTSADVTGTWIEVLGHVDVILHRAGLSYRELLQVLETRFVAAAGQLSIEGSDEDGDGTVECDTSSFRIVGLTEEVLGRIHRLVRLWRKLGWPLWEVDLLLPGAGGTGKQIDDDALRELAQLSRLVERTELDRRTVRALYRGIDDEAYVDRGTEEAAAVQTLYQRLFRNRLVDASSSFPPHPGELGGEISARIPEILAALRIEEADLGPILAELGLGRDDNLDAAALDGIFRIATLSRASGFDVDAFLRLVRLWGEDPFADTAAGHRFLDLAELVAGSGFTVPELDYLLAGVAPAKPGIALDGPRIVAGLQALREGLRKIAEETGLPAEESPQDYVRSRLGRLPGLLRDADQSEALAMVGDTWRGPLAERGAAIERLFGGFLDPDEAKVALAPIPAEVPPEERATRVAARFAFVQPGLEAELRHLQSRDFVCLQVATILGLDVPTATVLIDALFVPGEARSLLQAFLDPRLLDLGPDGSPLALEEPNYPALFAGLRLSHKVALLIERLRLRAEDVAWWLEPGHAAGMGWIEPGVLPTAPTAAAVPLSAWEAMQRFFAWARSTPVATPTPLEFAGRLLNEAVSSASSLADLAALAGWPAADLETLVAAFGWSGVGVDAIKQRLREPASLERMAACMSALARLGVGAQQALGWAVAEPASTDAAALRQAVKAKYELEQWQQAIQPISDQLREARRQALVAWLIAHPRRPWGQDWTDSDGLFSYFLIDVEMTPCTMTSRLKQALSSIQLFVQRCLMNLEPEVVVDTDLDDRWKQWEWMKRYRTWEANRKIFLYPENWLEPSLRREKSPFFKELEDELTQNEVTPEAAEQGYLKYLEKLDSVANLEIRTLYDEILGEGESNLHVFGRTRSSNAPTYWYRRRVDRGRWTPWEEVELEIESNNLVAGIHNRRLYLLWPQLVEGAEEPSSVETPTAESTAELQPPERNWRVGLFWSEMRQGKWTPKTLSDSTVLLPAFHTNGHLEYVSFRTRLAPYIQARMFTTQSPWDMAPASMSQFDKIGRQVTVSEPNGEMLLPPSESHYFHDLIRHEGRMLYFSFAAQQREGRKGWGEPRSDTESIAVLGKIDSDLTFTAIDSKSDSILNAGTFATWDRRRTYFVDYTWSRGFATTSSGVSYTTQSGTFQFWVHYHPFIELFTKELNARGLKGLLNRQIQIAPGSVPGAPQLFDFNDYAPAYLVTTPRPEEAVDFSYLGAYSLYNWELFSEVPQLMRERLAGNMRFDAALESLEHIVDFRNPDKTIADPETPQQRFWITKPFYEATKADYQAQRIERLLLAIAHGDPAVRAQVMEWRSNPFDPYLIARMRTVAHQKSIVMKYIETLIAYGDQLFRQDTIEANNEATQLYVLAASILGERPQAIPKGRPERPKTFYELEQLGVDDFGNALTEIENLIPSESSPAGPGGDAPELPHFNLLYFCIPNNEKLLALWDTVEDRLFKLRHCMNIEGVVRELPLFEPPIDPGLLVKATAAGVDIGAILDGTGAPPPLYRFTSQIERAVAMCEEVKALGAAMLGALEKKDAEALALLRSNNEQTMLKQMLGVRQSQISEAQSGKEALEEAEKVIEARWGYYDKLIADGLNTGETVSLFLTGGSILAEIVATVLNTIGAGTSLVPEFTTGVAGFGGTPLVTVTTGGKSVSNALGMAAQIAKGVGSTLQIGAGMAATMASYARREEEWEFQRTLATRELPRAAREIVAAEIRSAIAEKELANQQKQIELAATEGKHLSEKFTKAELYDWMAKQISTVYLQSYQLAYDLAKSAERCFRFELGLEDSNFVQFGYWDGQKEGLLAGERLLHDLKRLEAAYYERNRREYELTKNVSLAQLDPAALLKLRQNGECFIGIPETVFDMDHPGHYFRRLKSVGLSIPCVAGPNTSIACTLSLTSNQLRKDPTLRGGKYRRDSDGDDPRFRDAIVGIQSIATSSGRDDRGVFRLDFRDERYLPFEGAGAISSWHLQLNPDLPQFDFSTISDVILHVDYTARQSGLRPQVVEELEEQINAQALAESRNGLYHVIDLRREYADAWQRFLRPPNPADDQQLVLDDLAARLPYFTRKFKTRKATQVEVLAKLPDGSYKAQLSPFGTTAADEATLNADATYKGLHRAVAIAAGDGVGIDSWTLKVRKEDALDFKSLDPEAIEELFLVITYEVS